MTYFNIFNVSLLFFYKDQNQINNNINQISDNFNNFNNKNNNQYSININNNSQNKDKDIIINNLEEKIIILNKQLTEEKNKNYNLSKENSEMKAKIEQLNFKIINQNNFNNFNIQIKTNELYEKILDLQEKLKRFPFILEKNEKLMSIIFASVDQKIHYSIVCKNTDKIHKLEEELYREYPQFSETDNYFMCKGKVLNRFHSFEKNNIKNGDVIIVDQRDF